MSIENNTNLSEQSEISYEKAKGYWENVEPTVCGMLGGLPEVGFIGKTQFSDLFTFNFHNAKAFRYPSEPSIP